MTTVEHGRELAASGRYAPNGRDPYADVPSPEPPPDDGTALDGVPRLWPALELSPAAPPRWLAVGRLPRAAISLLVGEEGIGKSLLWVWLAAAITTGRPLPGFGIPQREPSHILLVLTEDDWSTTVRPRLDVAGADLAYVRVFCTDSDGSGTPVFPLHLPIIAAADPVPALIVVDAWLDTVPAGIQVRDPQQARQALHPWRDIATGTDAAVLLVTHTNRVASANARDRYGATGALRQKARMTLYAQTDDDGRLTVGPEKSNGSAPLPASAFTITAVRAFAAGDDGDGTVPRLDYAGESTMTARQHLAATVHDDAEPGGNPAEAFIRDYLNTADAEAPAAEVIKAGRAAGFNEGELKDARRRASKPRIVSRKAHFTGGWVWAVEYQDGSAPPQGGEGGEGGVHGGIAQ